MGGGLLSVSAGRTVGVSVYSKLNTYGVCDWFSPQAANRKKMNRSGTMYLASLVLDVTVSPPRLSSSIIKYEPDIILVQYRLYLIAHQVEKSRLAQDIPICQPPGKGLI